jgi:hypothetical protein
MLRIRVPLLAATVAVAGCSAPQPNLTWSSQFDLSTKEQLAPSLDAVRKFGETLKAAGLRQAGTAAATRMGTPGGDIRELTTTWRGDALGLRSLEVRIFERDVPADGPEIVVSVSAYVQGDADVQAFDALKARITELVPPKKPVV